MEHLNCFHVRQDFVDCSILELHPMPEIKMEPLLSIEFPVLYKMQYDTAQDIPIKLVLNVFFTNRVHIYNNTD